jgi:CelD/BcsL family acetyltransferase involved in cellulose biosynthesis
MLPLTSAIVEPPAISTADSIPRDANRIVNFAVIDAGNEPRWSQVARRRFSSLFLSPPWISALAKTYGFKINASVRFNAGQIEAAIPYCHVSDLRGDRIVSLPFSDYCDPLVEDRGSWLKLVGPLLESKVPVTFRCLQNSVPLDDSRFQSKSPALWHSVDLTRPEEVMWQGLDGSARQNIRKAQRNGVAVRHGRSIEDIRTFHRMHRALRKSKYRMLAQPLGFFESIFHEFARFDGINTLIAEQNGAPIAGIVLLEWNGTLYYKFNASVDQQHCPNDLLTWTALLFGRERGLARFDFGLSDAAQPGLVRYKRKFATEERQISFLQWRPEGFDNGRGEQTGDLLQHVTRWLTDPGVPEELTQAAGEKLYRLFC